MKKLSKVVLKLLKHKTYSPCLHNTNKEDAEQKPFSMTCGFAKGFTLIELLVVVLIIGILSAVALPQYRKAVLRSRFVQTEITAKALYDALKISYLANGAYPPDLSSLDIDIAPTASPSTGITSLSFGSGAGKYKCIYYNSAPATDSISCQLYDYPHLGVRYILEGNKAKYCVVSSTSALGNSLCKSVTGLSTPSSTDLGGGELNHYKMN